MNGAPHGTKDSEANSLSPKILLATDGPEDAAVAARAVAEIHVKTGSELHVATIGPRSAGGPRYPVSVFLAQK